MQSFHKPIGIAAVLAMFGIAGCSSDTGNPTATAEASTTSEAEPGKELSEGVWVILQKFKPLPPIQIKMGSPISYAYQRLLHPSTGVELLFLSKSDCEEALQIVLRKAPPSGSDRKGGVCVRDTRYNDLK